MIGSTPLRAHAFSMTTARRATAFVFEHKAILFALLASCFVFRAWLNPFTTIAGVDFPSLPEPIIRGGALGWPHLWIPDYDFGQSALFWASSFPVWLIEAPLHALGMPYGVGERFMWLWPYMFGAPIIAYWFCYRYTRNTLASALGATLFTVNSWAVGLVERGHIPSLVASALMPIVFVDALNVMERPTRKAAIRLAAVISIQCLYDIRYGVTAALIVAFAVLVGLPGIVQRRQLVRTLGNGLVFAVLLALLSLHFVLPAIGALSPPSGYTGSSVFLGISKYANLVSSFSLFYQWYEFYPGRDGFAITPIQMPFFLVAAAVWCGLLIKAKRKATRFAGALALVGIVLVSGVNSPFAGLNLFLFEHVAIFKLFRDYSKFTTLTVLGYSLGLANAFLLVAVLCRRHVSGMRSLPTIAFVVAFAAYLVVMRDAVNPLRKSNFAAVDPPTLAAQRTTSFLHDHLGDAKYIMFPADYRWRTASSRPFPAIGEDVATSPSPAGLSLLNPALNRGNPFLSLFASPLIPELLSELRVKYIVVPDEPQIYYPWDALPQRRFAVDFFRQQPWLHQVSGDDADTIFEVVRPPAPRAFFAPFPTYVLGSPATLEGLVGTPLWSNGAAALLEAQMPPGTAWLADLPNVVQGPTLIDRTFPFGGEPVQQLARLRAAQVSETYRHRAFSAWEMSSSMLTKSLLDWNNGAPFAFRMQNALAGDATASFLIEPRKKPVGIITQNGGRVGSPFVSDAPGTTGSCGSQFNRVASFGAEQRIAADATVGELPIGNTCPDVYRATVHLHLFSADWYPQTVTVTYGDATQSVTVPPSWLGAILTGDVTLPNAVLGVGTSNIRVTKAEGRAVIVAATYAISNAKSLEDGIATGAFRLDVRHAPQGDLIYGTVDTPAPGLFVGFLDLFGALDMRLDRNPLVTFRYAKSELPTVLNLVVDLRDRTDGSRRRMWLSFPDADGVVDLNLYDAVQSRLTDDFTSAVAFNAENAVWTDAHFANGPPTAADYTVTGIAVAASWTVSRSTDAPRGAYVALVRGIRLSTAGTTLASNWTYSQDNRIDMSGLTDTSFSVRGMKVIKSDSGADTAHRIAAQFIGEIPSSDQVQASLHVGDYIEVTTQNGGTVHGTIVAQSSGYVVVRDGGAPAQRLAVNSISTVNKQQITRTAVLHVPITTLQDSTFLSFRVRSDVGLHVRIGLTFAAGDGSRTTVPAVSRLDAEQNGVDVDPEFVSAFDQQTGELFDIAQPVDFGVGGGSGKFTSYLIDLWKIQRYRFGGENHRLVGFDVAFTEDNSLAGADRQYSIEVADAKLSNDRRQLSALERDAVHTPLMAFDATNVQVDDVRTVPELAGFATASTRLGRLAAGSHVASSIALDAVNVRAFTVSIGSPAPFGSGHVDDFDEVTPSEIRGTLRGNGVLIVPQAFDTGWRMALLPPGDSPPAVSGFALLDYLRNIRRFVPNTQHVPANTFVDAWYIPRDTPAGARFVMIYQPEAVNELAVVFELVVVIPLAVFLYRRRERTRPEAAR